MTLPTPYWQSDDGRATLYCGNSREIACQFGKEMAIVTDPPYGIAAKFGKVTKGGKNWPTRHHNTPIIGDESPFDPSPWIVFKECILWGANYYADKLPSGGWLVWDKRRGVEEMEWNRSEAELAFCKGQTTVKMFRHLWHGLCRDSEIGEHLHPTQKPIALMQWCVEMTDADTILDPFAGSGTTGVACIQTGRKFIGIELSEKYCAVAARRLAAACCEDGGLFDPKAKHRATLFEGAAP